MANVDVPQIWVTLLNLGFWFSVITLAVFFIFLSVLGFFAWRFKRFFREMLSPDMTVLEKKFDKLKQKYPLASEEDLLRKIIQEESRKAGYIGFITGLGGLFTLPLALPIDIIGTLRIQSRLASFLRLQRQVGSLYQDDMKIGSLALVLGVSKASDIGRQVLVKIVARFTPQVVLKAVPLLGGLVGFALDFAATKGVGQLVLRRALKGSTGVTAIESVPTTGP